jgi:Mg-chelatase subunit ChlD
MNEDKHNPPIEPDLDASLEARLEARIVAMLLGEASDFETDELQRLIQERPELAAFKREMEQVSELLQSVGHSELETPESDWKLPNERRQTVLDVLHGRVTTSENLRSEHGLATERPSELPRSRWRRFEQAVSVVVAIGIMVVMIGLMLPAVQMSRESARRLAESVPDAMPKSLEAAPSSEPSSLTSKDSGDTSYSLNLFSESEPAETRFRREPLAALSAIQDSLQQSIAPTFRDPNTELPPTSGAPQNSVAQTNAPEFNQSLNWSMPSNNNGIALPQSVPSFGMIADGTSNSMPYTAILPDPSDRRSSVAPEQADKLVAQIQGQPGLPPSGTLADFDAVVPDAGTVLLGDIKKAENKPGDASSLGLLALESTENHTEYFERQLSQSNAESDHFQSFGKQRRLARGTEPSAPPQSTQSDEVRSEPQIGQTMAGSGPVQNFDAPIPDPSKADQDGRYDYFNGRDINIQNGQVDPPGNMGDGMGDGMGGGGMGVSGMGSQVTPRFGKDVGGGMPIGGQPDAAEFEMGRSAPAKPGSASTSESLDLPIELNNEAGEGGVDEKKLAELDGEAFRSKEPELQKKQLDNKAEELREEEYLKRQSAEDSLERQSASQREFESQLMRGRQSEQKESIAELEAESDYKLDELADDGIDRKKGRVAPSRVQRLKESANANRDKQNAWQDETPQSEPEEVIDLGKKLSLQREAPSAGLNETNAATESFSTFSLHVSDVSFKLAAAALARGEWPEAAKIRIEEFVNALDYGDPLPGTQEKVACVVEQAIHPFLQQRNVLRVSMRTSAEGRANSTPLRLTLVLDNSGSMERIDRQQAVKLALSLLAQQLSPNDQVTLISFARQPRLLAENVSGADAGKLVEMIGQLPSEGGTNIEAALQLAFEKAAAQRTPGVQNRIVLLTDGAVNLGNAEPESLSRMVESMRTAGIAFDAAGISADGLNDEVLEALTRKGDGRYYLLDGEESSGGRFAQQIAGALRPSASNVKVQVEFNPKRVGQYKLLGFEKHLLQKEDFRNDAVDAAELAAAEAGVALYQFEAKPDGEGDIGSVSVRFRDLTTGQMVEHRWPIPYEAHAQRPDQASPSIRLATAAAMLAARLRGETLGETVDLRTLSDLIAGLPDAQQLDPRVQQLKAMIEQARQLSEQ